MRAPVACLNSPAISLLWSQQRLKTGLVVCALLAYPDLVLGAHAPYDSPSLVNSPEEGPLFSGMGHNLAPTPWPLEPPPLT